MKRAKLKKAGYITANTCGKLTRYTAIASAIFFVGGLIGSLIVDGCERREIKESFKTKK
jgi:hypothetical protein